MKRTLVYRTLRYVYRLSKKSYHILLRRQEKKKERLIFVYAGRSEGWPGLGRELYKKEADFKASIQYCNEFLLKNGGAEILSYFEQPIDIGFFDDEAKFTCLTAIQIASTIVFNKKGIFPNAVMGISMGETAAAFAAGALSIDEALKIAISYMSIFKERETDHLYIFIGLGYLAAEQFCADLPVYVEIIYEDSPNAVLVSCKADDLDVLQQKLTQDQVAFKVRSEKLYIPYHTSLITRHSSMLFEFCKNIEPKPLRCDYYSPTLGKIIPKYTILDQKYWVELACKPVLFGRTLQSVIDDGYDKFLQIGAPAISSRQFGNMSLKNKMDVHCAFDENAEELEHFISISKKVNRISFEETLNIGDQKAKVMEGFIQNFDIHSITDSPAYEYLRQNGPIHFIPHHNAWLILNYDDTEYVLKEPDIFSSSIFKDVDPILIGADPELHKVTRNLLRPLFSASVMADLGSFTSVTADAMLSALCKQDSFDVVVDFSNPLSLFVLCNFFGLSAADAHKMLNFTGLDYKDPSYWERLDEYFNLEFEICDITNQESLWARLRALVKLNSFSIQEAISLLKIIWTAGIATTSGLISACIQAILTDPELSEKLAGNDRHVGRFIEEALRLLTPVTAIHRITGQPTELAGQSLREGEIVLLHLKSAMTDPKHFSNPGEFSIHRPAKKHLAFGTGIHQCIGMGIARTETFSAISMILKYLPQLKEYDCKEPQYMRSSEIQPMTTLILTRKISNV